MEPLPSVQPLRLSPSYRFAAVFGPALLVLVFGAASYWGTVRERASRGAVAESHRTIEDLQDVLTTLVNAETGERGYLLTGDRAYLAPFSHAGADLRRQVGELKRLTVADPPAERANVDSLSAAVGLAYAEVAETIALRERGGADAARTEVASARGSTLMDRARALASALRASEEGELAAHDRSEARNSALLIGLVVLGAGASAVVTFLVNRLLQRYGVTQEAFAGELQAANGQLQTQRGELERQNAQLQAQSGQLEEQAAELSAQNEALHELTAELEARTAAAEEANLAKSRFLAAMSHDLRTPLNAITGYAELLEIGVRGPVAEAQVRDLQRIRNSSRHLLSLINGILDFARIEAGRVEVRAEPVPIGALIRGVESSFLPQAREKRLRYESDAGPDGVWVSADPERAEQVLLNLVANAIKFTDAGGEISVRCVEDGDAVAVQVRDTGRGIAPAQLATIFEPFVQVDREVVPEGHRGVGLGLAISRELATAMGGDLSVRSEVGRGSTFTLRLPRVPAPPAASVRNTGAAATPARP